MQVQLITNHELPVLFCFKTKGISKYKKVSKEKKLQLLRLTSKDKSSIIDVDLGFDSGGSLIGYQLLYRQEHHPQPQEEEGR